MSGRNLIVLNNCDWLSVTLNAILMLNKLMSAVNVTFVQYNATKMSL